MRITLQIENVDRLETGGQVTYTCADRGFDIGRHEYLDWSLPDPHRVISGKHCEVRFEDGRFVLHDVSTNGTFLNGNPNRLDRPHVLMSGDRLLIGDYLIAVSLEAASVGASPPSRSETPAPSAAPWAPPVHHQTPAVHAPTWPDTASGADRPYPEQSPTGGGSHWPSPSSGMEGRHAPPSSAPGIGTPADDVWGQQSHGGGNADPAFYDPGHVIQPSAPARPVQADPLDHLAEQPRLRPWTDQPSQDQAGGSSASIFPDVQPSGFGGPLEAPLFGLPDLPDPEPPVVSAAPADPEPETDPFGASGSPFPGVSAQDGEPAPMPTPTPESPQKATAPEPIPSPLPDTAAAPDAGGAPSQTDLLAAFARGAGIPESVLARRDPEAFAEELGVVLQSITGDLMGLLQARSQVKAMTRNSNRTLISRSGNNALKFSPTPMMALQTMLAGNAEENGYLPLRGAMSAAFKDIQKHHVWTYAAMQKAAARFEETLSPKAIEAAGPVEKGTFGNAKAKLWERMQERWGSLTASYDDGLVGVFTQYFTESYEDLSRDDPDNGPGTGF